MDTFLLKGFSFLIGLLLSTCIFWIWIIAPSPDEFVGAIFILGIGGFVSYIGVKILKSCF